MSIRPLAENCRWLEVCPVNDFAHTHELPEPYTRGFGILKDEIDPAAPHNMASIRANIAKWRKSLRPDVKGTLREDSKDMGRGAASEMV